MDLFYMKLNLQKFQFQADLLYDILNKYRCLLNIFQFCLFFLITSIEEIQVNQLFLLFSWYWFWRKFRAVSKKEELWYIQLLQGLFRALPQNFELKLVTEIVSSIHFTFTRNNGKFMDKAVLVLLMLVLFYEKQRNWNRLYFTICKITSCGQCFMSFNFFYQRRTGNRKSFLTRIFNVEGGEGRGLRGESESKWWKIQREKCPWAFHKEEPFQKSSEMGKKLMKNSISEVG